MIAGHHGTNRCTPGNVLGAQQRKVEACNGVSGRYGVGYGYGAVVVAVVVVVVVVVVGMEMTLLSNAGGQCEQRRRKP